MHGQDAGSHFLPQDIPERLKLSFQGFRVINTPDDVSVLSVWVPSPPTFQRLLSLDLLGPHHRFMCTANYWSRTQSPHLTLAPRRPVPSQGHNQASHIYQRCIVHPILYPAFDIRNFS